MTLRPDLHPIADELGRPATPGDVRILWSARSRARANRVSSSARCETFFGIWRARFTQIAQGTTESGPVAPR